MKKEISDGFRQKKPKNRRNKVTIEFDEKKRFEYLTGFSKRKNERRKKAKEEEIQMLKEKKRQIKEKKKSEYTEHMVALKQATTTGAADPCTTATVVKETTHTCASHTVTVTELDLVGGLTDRLGENKMAGMEHEDDSDREEYSQCVDKTAIDVSKKKDGNRTIEGRKKEKRRKKPHVSYTHAHHRHKKLTPETRLHLKKQLKKKSNRAHK
jgi:ribosomal RNA-processing protein 17